MGEIFAGLSTARRRPPVHAPRACHRPQQLVVVICTRGGDAICIMQDRGRRLRSYVMTGKTDRHVRIRGLASREGGIMTDSDSRL
jgi:hypothetical protein